jgi:hypothetical protein
MSGSGSWLQFANRMNKFKGSYFQDFADISGNVIVRNTGNVYLHAGSNMYMAAGDISMNGFVYCKGVVDLSGNSLSGGGDGGGGGLTSVSTVSVKSINTTDFVTTSGYASIGNYLNVTGSTTLTGQLTANGASIFNGQMDGAGASFNTLSVGNVELKGSIIPDTNATYDIGSAEKKIRDLYVSDSSIWIGDNNKLAIENDKITMKKRKKGNSDIPKFISDKLTTYIGTAAKVEHVKYFASLPANSLGKGASDELSTYTVSDWIRFANKKGSLSEDGFTKTNHTASDLYDLANDFDNDDSGQWTTVSTGVIKYDGKITVGNDVNTSALETLGKTSLVGKVNIGAFVNSNVDLYVNGNTTNSGILQVDGTTFLSTTNIASSLSVTQNANISGKMGVGKDADSTFHLDVLGKARVQDDAYLKKSLLVGTAVNSTSLTTNGASGASMYVETKMNAGVYPDISHNVVLDVPNTLFKGNDESVTTNKNYIEFDTAKRRIIPYVKDSNGNFINGTAADATGWDLGGPGQYRFDKIHARDLNISDSTINIEDASGNKIGMSFDATTGAVNYTVTTKDTADASGETFVIKGVQTQKISSGGGTIDPALLEFTGLSFGDTFDSAFTYDLTSTYTYNLTTNTYVGDGVSTFTNSAGAQGLNAFISATNETTLLGSLPTKESAVIRVGADDRADGGLNGIDTPGSKVDLTNKIISVSDDDGGTTLKWTLWGSETELNATTPGNFLNYIELKNINMASGTYFVAKTGGNIVYNNANEDYLQNADLTGVVNGDLFLYIDRAPGNNWTKIPVSLPASGSITTQMLTDSVIQSSKIATNAVTGSKILDGAVTTNKIADDSITAVKFKAGEINGTIFADDAIDGAKISGNIAATKLTGTISGANITDNTIVSSKIVDGGITSAKIAYLGVSGDNLMNDSVTTLKIADEAVISSKIQDGAITSAKLASSVINSDTLIADNVITESKIFGGSVTEAKLASLSVGSTKIKDDAITETKIADGAVTLAKINGSVFAGKQDTLIAGTGISIDSGTNTISSTVSSTTYIAGTGITIDQGTGTISATGGSGDGGGATGGGGSSSTFVAAGLTAPLNSSMITSMHGDTAGLLKNNSEGFSMSDDGNTIVSSVSWWVYVFKKSGSSYTRTKIDLTTISSGLNTGDLTRISGDGLTIVRATKLSATYSAGIAVLTWNSASNSWGHNGTVFSLASGFSGATIRNIDITRDGSKILTAQYNSTTNQKAVIYDTTQGTPLIAIDLNGTTHNFNGWMATNIFNNIHGKNAQMALSGDGSRCVIGGGTVADQNQNTGRFFVFDLDYTNNTYSEVLNLTGSTAGGGREADEPLGTLANKGACFGRSVAINYDGTRIANGYGNPYFNYGYNLGAPSPLRVAVYHFTGTTLDASNVIIPDGGWKDGENSDYPYVFGYSLSFTPDSDKIITGCAFGWGGAYGNSGVVQVYAYASSAWSFYAALKRPDYDYLAGWGTSVAMTNGGKIAIGSLNPPSPPSGVANSGEIEIYTVAPPSIYTDTFESTDKVSFGGETQFGNIAQFNNGIIIKSNSNNVIPSTSNPSFNSISSYNLLTNVINTNSSITGISNVSTHLSVNSTTKTLSQKEYPIDVSELGAPRLSGFNGASGITLSPDGKEFAWVASNTTKKTTFVYRYNETTDNWTKIHQFGTTTDTTWAERCEFSPCGNYINANHGDNFNLHVSTMYEGHKIAKKGADGQWNNTSIISINGFLSHGSLPSYNYFYKLNVSHGGKYAVVLSSSGYNKANTDRSAITFWELDWTNNSATAVHGIEIADTDSMKTYSDDAHVFGWPLNGTKGGYNNTTGSHDIHNMSTSDDLTLVAITGHIIGENGTNKRVRVYKTDYVNGNHKIIFELATTASNSSRNVCLNPDGSYMSIANGGHTTETVDIYKYDQNNESYSLIQTITHADLDLETGVKIGGFARAGCIQFARGSNTLIISAPQHSGSPSILTHNGIFIFDLVGSRWVLTDKEVRNTRYHWLPPNDNTRLTEMGARIAISDDGTTYAFGEPSWAEPELTNDSNDNVRFNVGRAVIVKRHVAAMNVNDINATELHSDSITTRDDANIGGNLIVDGYIKSKGLIQPLTPLLNTTITDPIVTPIGGNGPLTAGLGTSYGERVCMSDDGTIIITANVALQNVYILRKTNNVWDEITDTRNDVYKTLYNRYLNFGKVITLSGDGKTLVVSNLNTMFVYSISSTGSPILKYQYTDTDYTVGFCTMAKINYDGTRLVVMSYMAYNKYTIRVYDPITNVTITPTLLVTLQSGVASDMTTFDIGLGHNGIYGGRNFYEWTAYKMEISGDGKTVVFGGNSKTINYVTTNNWNKGRCYVYDIDYTNNTSTSVLEIEATMQDHLPYRAYAINSNATVLAITCGSPTVYQYGPGTDAEPRVEIYRRSLSSPTNWTLEKTYYDKDMSSIIGSGSGASDGFGEKLAMSNDGNILYIGQQTVAYTSVQYQLPTWHNVGRVENHGGQWGDMLTLRGPSSTWWGTGMATSGDGKSLVVMKLWGQGSNGSCYIYDMNYNDLPILAPNKLILGGGGFFNDVSGAVLPYNSHMIIDASGNVGINSDPIEGVKLHVEGDITFSGTSSSSSDDRLKVNEELITGAIDTIKKLKPEIYDKRADFHDITYIKESGLIAQEVWYKTPELRHLVTLGMNITDTTIAKPLPVDHNHKEEITYVLNYIPDASGNIITDNDIYKCDASGNIIINANHELVIDTDRFLLQDLSGNNVLYKGKNVLDIDKLATKGIIGTHIVETEEPIITNLTDGIFIHPNDNSEFYLDSNGKKYTDISNGQLMSIETDTHVVTGADGRPFIDISGILNVSNPRIVVNKNVNQHAIKSHLVNTKKYTPINPSDIQDYTPTDDIQNDPDYKALGWGDTPARLNYNGLIPYLIKAIQEQQEIIDTLKGEVDTLKNA